MEVRVLGTVGLATILQRDEAALSQGRPLVQVALNEHACVSVGISPRWTTEVTERAQGLGLPVYQRRSGGTALYHAQGDLLWSIVVPRDPRWKGQGLVHAYGRLGAGWVHFLEARGIESQWALRGREWPSLCYLSGLGQVLQVQDRVLGGASQHLAGRALLHHGAVPVTLDPVRLEQLFAIPSAQASRSLTCLEALGLPKSPGYVEELAQAIAAPWPSQG